MAVTARRRQKWQEIVQAHGPLTTKKYSLEDSFHKGDFIEHKTFGTGYVKSIHANKIEVFFEDKNRVLIHKLSL